MAFRIGGCGNHACIAEDSQQHLSMLTILHAASTTAVDHFRAAGNPVDGELLADLEKMVERTRGEIERLAALLASRSQGSEQ